MRVLVMPLALCAALLVSCDSDDNNQPPAADSGVADATPPDAHDGQEYGDAAAGEKCELNRSCQMGLRCECTEEDGCACQPGERGTGRNGVDSCTAQEDCASSLCVELTNDTGLCSDECDDDNDCEPGLPRCLPVFGLSFNICSPAPGGGA